MAYSDFLDNVNQKFNSLFTEISTEYNFDNGPEFEIALCKALRLILPKKYGICRGFIVSADGNVAGDDIIIYDQERFPTLRLLTDSSFSQKQKIPVEAVYVYIEAKHTLYIDGNGGQSLEKALSQINAVKNIDRAKLPLTMISPQIGITNFNPNRPSNWPDFRNPLYTAIIARNVKINDPKAHPRMIVELQKKMNTLEKQGYSTDLIIAGENLTVVPTIGTQIESPFFVENQSEHSAVETSGQAFAAGLISLIWALDNIMLGTIKWPKILAESLDIHYKE